VSEAAFEVASAVRLSDSPQLRTLIEKASTAILNSNSSPAQRAQSSRVLGPLTTSAMPENLEDVFTVNQLKSCAPARMPSMSRPGIFRFS
jgi:hypothetical protein